MALARIITRSEECARELSEDLLARGYAVEVVSPEEIPVHTADLELRVETGDGKTLTANVKVQHGERSASLDFVHQLQAPVAEVSRPERQQGLNVRGIARTEQVANATAAASRELVRDKEESQLPLKAASLATEPDRDVDEASAKLISDTGFASKATDRPEPPPLAPLDSGQPITVAIADTSAVRPEIFRRATPHRRSNRPEGWQWRTAIGFAAVVLLALVAGFGISRKSLVSNSGESGKIAATAPGQISAAYGDVALSTFIVADGPAPEFLSKPAMTPDPKLKEMAGPKKATPTRGATSEAIGKSLGDFVARDTVVYLDERYKPAPKTKPSNQLARQQPGSRKHGGVIAANSVTYLNDKPTSKPK